jgi:hypothetical protein
MYKNDAVFKRHKLDKNNVHAIRFNNRADAKALKDDIKYRTICIGNYLFFTDQSLRDEVLEHARDNDLRLFNAVLVTWTDDDYPVWADYNAESTQANVVLDVDFEPVYF